MECIKPSQTRLFRSRTHLETPMTQSPDIPAACPVKARLLELRFFAGLTLPEIAALTALSEKTLQRH